MVVLAPISTSSSMTTVATCGIFSCVPSSRCANPNPSLPIDGAVLDDAARADDDALANRDAGMDHAVGTERRVAADDDVGVQDRARADAGAALDDHVRTDRDVVAERRVGRDECGWWTPAAGRCLRIQQIQSRARTTRYGFAVRSTAQGASATSGRGNDRRRARARELLTRTSGWRET